MAKLTLTDLTTLTNQTSAVITINANHAAIEAALENTLSLDGTTPNAMEVDFDMNDHQILNLPTPVDPTDVVRLQDLDAAISGGLGIPDGDKGDVTISGFGSTITIDNDVVTNAKAANMAANSIKGNNTAGIADPLDLTAAQVRTLINVADGANNYVHPNHSGDVTSSGDGATTIAADTVTNTKLANMAANSIKGNNTGGIADPLDLTAAQVRTLINVADGANNYVHPNHSGDVTSSGGGATTIAADVVTNTKLANMAASTIKGNNTGGSADPLDLTAAQVRTLINVADGANNYVHPNHSGDVTSVNDGATTIANNVVTNAKLADVATATFKGRTTAGTGDPEDLTATQATALLNIFTSALKGLVPASGGSSSDFLRADGLWAVPAGGGGGSLTSGQTTIDFGAFPGTGHTSVAVTGQGSIASGSEVHCWIMATATSDHSVDEHVLDAPHVIAGDVVAGTGFTIYGVSRQPDKNSDDGKNLDNRNPTGTWTVGWFWN